MRVGWLSDPRAHLAGVALLVWGVASVPEASSAVVEAERVAVERLDRAGSGLWVALGIEEPEEQHPEIRALRLRGLPRAEAAQIASAR